MNININNLMATLLSHLEYLCDYGKANMIRTLLKRTITNSSIHFQDIFIWLYVVPAQTKLDRSIGILYLHSLKMLTALLRVTSTL